MRYLRSMACIAALLAAIPALAAAEPRPGDPDSKPDAARFDPNYPDMKEWASAGVRGGIPLRDTLKVVKTIKPGDDLQAAIDAAAKEFAASADPKKPEADKPVVVLLSTGTHSIRKAIELRSGVVLRGQNKELAVIENTLRSTKLSPAAFTVRADKVRLAGIEDLTLRHEEVARLGLAVYAERVAGPKNNPNGVKDLHVGGVEIEDSEDCWLDNVNILHSGSHPLDAAGRRITVRDVLIDGAFNKGEEGSPAGSGNVYFSVTGGLFYNNTVKNTRHCLVIRDTLSGGDCKFNVMLDCNFQGDVNYHGNRKDSGRNLFEGVFVRSLTSHGWPAWAYWKREEIGLGNLAYKSIGWGGSNADKFESTKPDVVYTFTGIRDPNILAPVEKPAPTAGTLYAVTATRPTRPESLGTWPKNPGEARDMMLKRMIASPIK
ncbi:right-handed parallel beta-helix repeat-containing protein [Humisphaera borealis]|uniref:Right handed beta helix domain-containing protein n=1 Tax=Humisphaera borealis TaxID=2807512 RepID=A0A7M2X217_9BACT|nr:hypothetical protein [Humisphaera borealis]QOV91797.1 hypothetical protein IPV69_10760 [Humisphaera borealis]